MPEISEERIAQYRIQHASEGGYLMSREAIIEAIKKENLWKKEQDNLNTYNNTGLEIEHLEESAQEEQAKAKTNDDYARTRANKNIVDNLKDAFSIRSGYASQIFPNLKKIDCSYNPIKLLNISKNHELECIRFEGARGRIPHKLDFTGNPHLKEVRAGQDGVVELDFSSNQELERVSAVISNSLRWINIDNCPNLKSIVLHGAIIPFVDLTHCKNLNNVNIHYWNLYRDKYDEFGPGYPRPIIFVADDFDENVIDETSRKNKYYAYYLVRVKENSVEERFLQKVKSMKSDILSIPSDINGEGVARIHYDLLKIYKSLKSE